MEDSDEFDPMFAVPASIDDSQRFKSSTEDPLGLSSNGKLAVESSSFSCLQLSGVTPYQDSESLCIDEDHDSVIPSSPEAMHIDLSATPSAELDNGTSQSNAEQDGARDDGRMSPDMMAVGDKLNDARADAAVDSIGENYVEGTHKTESKDSNNSVGVENTSVVMEGADMNCENSNGSDPYNADTMLYTDSADDSKQASFSVAFNLPKTNSDSNSVPIADAASSQENSEQPAALAKPALKNCDILQIYPDDTPPKHDEEKSGSHIAHDDKELQNMQDSQEHSQPELDLHLTFDSQQSEGLSLATVDISNSALPDENHSVDKTDEIERDQATENDESRPQAERESGFSPDFTSFASDVSISNGIAAPLTPIAEAECAIISSVDDDERLSAENAYGDCKAMDDIPTIEENNANTTEDVLASPLDMKNPEIDVEESSQQMDKTDCDRANTATEEAENQGESKGDPEEDTEMDVHDNNGKVEITPSMQSTFVNESQSSLLVGVTSDSLDDTWADGVESSFKESSFAQSNDASLECSLLERSEILEMDTQSFTLSRSKEATSESTALARDDAKEVCDVEGDNESADAIRDVVSNMIDSVVEDNQPHVADAFLNPNLPARKPKKTAKYEMVPLIKRIDGNNNNFGSEERDNAEHEKSSDTLPVDEGSDHDIDTMRSPDQLECGSPNKAGLLYRVTRSEVIDTLLHGEVISTKVVLNRVRYQRNRPPHLSSSQSSSGSGYLGDTSGLSRSSSNSSGQRNFRESPVAEERPSFTSSSSDFDKFARYADGSSTTDRATSPIATISALPAKSLCAPATSISPIVVLTPLSAQLMSCHTRATPVDKKACADVVTPSLSHIDPPINGSTPLEEPPGCDATSSDVDTTNSPEFGYPGDTNVAMAAVYQNITKNSPTVSITPLEATDLHKRGGDATSSDVDTSNSPEFGYCGKATTNVAMATGNKGIAENPPAVSMEVNHLYKDTPGIPVLARPPREVFFYPGSILVNAMESGKYTVVFDDDKVERKIRENDVLFIDKLELGQQVYVQEDGQSYYSEGKIVSYCQVNNESGYVVELDSDSETEPKKEKRFPKKRVIVKQTELSKQQMHSLLQPLTNVSSSDVSLDNIVDGKRKPRRSCTRAAASPAASPSPGSSRTPKSSRKRKSTSVDQVSTRADAKRTKLVYQKVKDTGLKVLFGRMCFLLTSTSGQSLPSEADSDMSAAGTGYNRAELRMKIKAGAGEVVRTFSQLLRSNRDDLFVISDRHCRTMNYFCALAAGVKCVSYQWIVDSTTLKSLRPISSYLLPAGYSVQEERVVERSTVVIRPLLELKVYLRLTNNELWRPLLCHAGCDIMTEIYNVSEDSPLNCDVVIADSSSINDVSERIGGSDIPVVTIEWAIQCLIMSEKLHFYAHPQFTNFL